MKRSEIYFSVALIPLDFLALLLAFIVAYYLRDNYSFTPEFATSLTDKLAYNPQIGILPLTQYLHYIWYIIPVMLLIFAVSGLYVIRSTTGFWKRFSHIVFGVSAGEFFILLLFLLKRSFFLPRLSVLYSWILGILFVVIIRQIVRLFQLWLHSRNVGVQQVGIIGMSTSANQVEKSLRKSKGSFYKIVFHIKGMDPAEVIEQLEHVYVDELIVVNEQYTAEDLITIRNYCLEKGISFSFVPSLLTSLQSNFTIRVEGGLPTIEVLPTPLEGWGRVYKRTFDIIVSVILLIICLPLNLIIALLMKITDPGPLIFRHPRIGRNNKTIYVSKYRSMRVGWSDSNGKISSKFERYLKENPAASEEWNAHMKLKDDPRISKIGKFLRKTRLDELPQFFDVLTGSLSLVGPRPIITSEIERFGEKARILFTVRPGVTGLWQVRGGNALSYDERVILNSYYIEHWTPWMDIQILLETAVLVISDFFRRVSGSEDEGSTY